MRGTAPLPYINPPPPNPHSETASPHHPTPCLTMGVWRACGMVFRPRHGDMRLSGLRMRGWVIPAVPMSRSGRLLHLGSSGVYGPSTSWLFQNPFLARCVALPSQKFGLTGLRARNLLSLICENLPTPRLLRGWVIPVVPISRSGRLPHLGSST